MFPKIENVEDIVAAVATKDEVKIYDRGDFLVANYNVNFGNTFDIDENVLVYNKWQGEIPAGLILRECRGLIFSKDTGNLLSRPFHKFFNIGEREETRIENLPDLNYMVMEKRDGSMMRPVFARGSLCLATKMGVTEVAEKAQTYLTEMQKIWLGRVMVMGYTPLLEWTAPENRIVVSYQESSLTLLAIRENFTGEYMTFDQIAEFIPPFDVVQRSLLRGNQESIQTFCQESEKEDGCEGYVLSLPNGFRAKLKNEWYRHLHRAISEIETYRNILRLIADSDIDDLKPSLNDENLKKVEDYEKSVAEAFSKKVDYLETFYQEEILPLGDDKKAIATQAVPKLNHAFDKSAIFNMVGGKSEDFMEYMFEAAKKSVTSKAKYTEFCEWIELDEKYRDL